MTNPIVSVIIPTKESEETLSPCLLSLRAQSYSEMEVIVVDDRSTDNTVQIAQKYTDKVISKEAGRSESRNLGARSSSGQYLLFVDSDMELGRGVVEECVSLCKSADAVIIPELSMGEGFWSYCVNLEKRLYFGNPNVETAIFFSRHCFFEIGGYDEDLEAGEDWDIHIRISSRFKVSRASQIIKHNEGETTLTKMFLRKYRYGRTIRKYTQKHRSHAGYQLSPARFAKLDALREFKRTPAYGCGLIFLKIVEFIGLTLGSLFPSTVKKGVASPHK